MLVYFIHLIFICIYFFQSFQERKSPCWEIKDVGNLCRMLSITLPVKLTSLGFESSSSANIKGVEFSPLELFSEVILFLNTEVNFWVHRRVWTELDTTLKLRTRSCLIFSGMANIGAWMHLKKTRLWEDLQTMRPEILLAKWEPLKWAENLTCVCLLYETFYQERKSLTIMETQIGHGESSLWIKHQQNPLIKSQSAVCACINPPIVQLLFPLLNWTR